MKGNENPKHDEEEERMNEKKKENRAEVDPEMGEQAMAGRI